MSPSAAQDCKHISTLVLDTSDGQGAEYTAAFRTALKAHQAVENKRNKKTCLSTFTTSKYGRGLLKSGGQQLENSAEEVVKQKCVDDAVDAVAALREATKIDEESIKLLKDKVALLVKERAQFGMKVVEELVQSRNVT